ncbi:MAG: OmpA family protein [Pseudomonadota bacterium]
MRVVVGAVCLIIGVGVLGWWATTRHAPSMETDIAQTAAAQVADAKHPLTITVEGRDITVSGMTDTDADRDAILAGLNTVPGRRVIDDAMTVLPTASPYLFSATKDSTSVIHAGNTPTDLQRNAFAALIGADADGLTLAAGMPDDQWPIMVAMGLNALSHMQFGTMILSDRTLTLNGQAALPVNADAALAAVANVPSGYVLNTDITLEDDGTPMRLTVRKDDTGAVAVGKVPVYTDLPTLEQALALPLDASAVQTANIGGPIDSWATDMATALRALGVLDSGTLAVQGTELQLSGTAKRATKSQAETLIAGLAPAFTIRTDIELVDDGKPFALSIDTGADPIAATGKLPYGMDPALIASIIGAEFDKSAVAQAEIESAGGLWPTAVAQALGALALMEQGQLTVVDRDITLTGAVPYDDRMTFAALLSDIDDSFSITQDTTISMAAIIATLQQVQVTDPSAANCKATTAEILGISKINFVTGSADLDQFSTPTLDALARILTICLDSADLQVAIEGHTDNTGDPTANQTLSNARANSVLAALTQRDVDNTHITAVGYGAAEPIADNGTPEGRAANRRTVFSWSDIIQEQPQEPVEDAAPTAPQPTVDGDETTDTTNTK